MQNTNKMTSKSTEVSTLRALLVVSFTFLGSLVLILYSVLGMMSLLMYLFPWAP